MNNPLLRQRLIDSLRKNVQVLGHLLPGVTQAEASTWRDGPNGWTILEIVCHLRDYDTIFLERCHLMMSHNHPTFPVYDHLAMVVERAYNQQDLAQAYAALAASRESFTAFFNELEDAHWQRTGQHVEQGLYTLYTLVAHVSWHDINHIEQITRILAENRG